MQKLEAGIHHFQANYFASNRRLFEKLAEGQRPETLFITCSDSRVVPNLITSASPGDLFIVRNVGNIVPSLSRGLLGGGVSSAIEYAVEVLEVGHVIVCGHTNCGAIDAILNPQRVKHLPYVARWLSESESIPKLIEERYGHLEPAARMVAAVQENVLVQLENLRTFEFVKKRLEAGKLKMSGWVFKIATGEVFDYDPVSEQFLRLGAGDDERARAPLSTRPPPP